MTVLARQKTGEAKSAPWRLSGETEAAVGMMTKALDAVTKTATG